MTDEQAAKLRALAERATPGPWFVRERPNIDGTVDIETGRESDWPPAQDCEQPTAAYIAAVSPGVLLALLHERDAAMALLRECREQFEIGDPAWCEDSPLFARLVALLGDGHDGPEHDGPGGSVR